MYHNFKNLPITINNNQFVINSATLSQSMGMSNPLKENEWATEESITDSPNLSNLRIKYYLTGADFLKNYIYSNSDYPLSTNVAGITYAQGYLKEYSINATPNSTLEVDANIMFFDKPNGNLTPTTTIYNTGHLLTISDAIISNYAGYTENVTNILSQFSYNYQADITSDFSDNDSNIPISADKVSIDRKKITAEIISDNTNFNLPISGEDYGIQVKFVNPYNTGSFESIECSGKINTKTFSLNSNSLHSNSIQVVQSHLNNFGEISGIITGTNSFIIKFANGYHPITSTEDGIHYVSKISVGEILCPNYIITRQSTYDEITVTYPGGISDGFVNVYSTKKNFITTGIIDFPEYETNITSLSKTGGYAGDYLYITGTNFYQISQVLFNNEAANFQVLNPTKILAAIPEKDTVSFIKVISNARQKTGVAPYIFWTNPYLTNVSPTTGYWGQEVILSGYNLTGITGVLFNNINATGFTINGNKIVTYSPPIYSGYAGGNISIRGTGGFANAPVEYRPEIPIYGFEPQTGFWGNSISGYLKIDPDYLYKIDPIISTGYLPITIPTGLSLWYRFDGDTTDSSLNFHNSGKLVNGGVFTTDISGFANSAIKLNGVNQYLTTDDIFNSLNSWTASIWWSGNHSGCLLSRGLNGAGNGWSIDIRPTGAQIFAGSSPTQINCYPSSFTNNNLWNNTTIVWQTGYGLSYYNNGISGAMTPSALTGLRSSTSGVVIGRGLQSSAYFSGNLDNIKIYNYPLSSGAIWSGYNQTPHITLLTGYNIISGYKARIGGVDTILNPLNTGIITGSIPQNGITDYIYYYRPDGVTTYSPNKNLLDLDKLLHLNTISPIIIYPFTYSKIKLNGYNFDNFDNTSTIIYQGTDQNSGIRYEINYPTGFGRISTNKKTLDITIPSLFTGISGYGSGYFDFSIENIYTNPNKLTGNAGLFLQYPKNLLGNNVGYNYSSSYKTNNATITLKSDISTFNSPNPSNVNINIQNAYIKNAFTGQFPFLTKRDRNEMPFIFNGYSSAKRFLNIAFNSPVNCSSIILRAAKNHNETSVISCPSGYISLWRNNTSIFSTGVLLTGQNFAYTGFLTMPVGTPSYQLINQYYDDTETTKNFLFTGITNLIQLPSNLYNIESIRIYPWPQGPNMRLWIDNIWVL